MVALLLTTNVPIADTGFGQLPPEPVQVAQEPQKPDPPKYIEVMANISAYTPSVEECGKDDGITASGAQATEGRTIAMDDVPFGTKVEIDGREYIVEDRFGGRYRNRVDIFMASRADANRFGRQYKTIKVYVEGE
jgi:3D (Asp-Asp-Asp) domain-containing protein